MDTPKLPTDSGGNISGNNDSVPQGEWMNLFPPTEPSADTRNLRSVVFLSLEAYKNVGSVRISLNCVADLICCAACSTQCWQATWKYHSLGFNFHYLKKNLFGVCPSLPNKKQKNSNPKPNTTHTVYRQFFISVGFKTSLCLGCFLKQVVLIQSLQRH